MTFIAPQAFFHAIINNSYGPLEKALPLTLANKMYNPDANAEQGAEGGSSDKGSSDYHFVSNSADSKSREQPESEEDAYGFAHPAVSRPQRTIWLPRDALGLAGEEERECKDAGVDASVGPDATMDEKGKVDVTGYPPEVQALLESEQ